MDDDVLASDAERDAAAATLRTHHAEGRLTTEEFSARVEAVYAARTRGDVAKALERLPAAPLLAQPRPRLAELALRQAAVSAVPVAICVLVWAFTGAQADFWPKWVILAVLIGLVGRVGRAAAGDAEARAELERKFERRRA